MIRNLSRYLLCANCILILALVCAWREIGYFYKNGDLPSVRDLEVCKCKENCLLKMNIFPGSCYVLLLFNKQHQLVLGEMSFISSRILSNLSRLQYFVFFLVPTVCQLDSTYEHQSVLGGKSEYFMKFSCAFYSKTDNFKCIFHLLFFLFLNCSQHFFSFLKLI